MKKEWQEIADTLSDEDLISVAEQLHSYEINSNVTYRKLYRIFDASYEITDFLAQALAQRLKAHLHNDHINQLP